MGVKGSKLTAESGAASERLVESLSGLGDVTRKKMFGGYGVFESGVMFALVSSEGDVYFRATDDNRASFESEGCEKFGKMPYYALPDGVADDSKALLSWASRSVDAAHTAKGK